MTSERLSPWSSRLRRSGGEFLRYALSFAPQVLVPQGRGFKLACAALRESEYWSAERLREFADARLRDLVTYARSMCLTIGSCSPASALIRARSRA